MKERNSIFSKVLENCGSYFSIACKDILSGVQDFNDQTFIEYLRDFQFNDSRFQTSLFACGNVGAARPLESFHFLVSSFPDIDINSRVEPTSRTPTGGSNFIYLLGSIKWDNKYIRASVKYTIIYIISKICRYITMQSTKTLKKKEAAELIDNIYEFINAKPEPFHVSMCMLVINEFKMAISYASVSVKSKTFDILKSIFSGIQPKSSDLTTLLFKTFSETVLKFEDENQVNELLSLIVNFYNGKDDTSKAAAACILNIIGQACVLFPKFRSSDEIVSYYNKAAEYKDEASYELCSLILAFTSNKDIKMNIKEFSKKCFSTSKDDDECATYTIKAITRFMYGKNYIPKSLQLLENEQYSWHVSKDDYKDYLDAFEIIKKNISFVSKASVESQTDLLLQIACNDVNNFVDDVMRKISKDENVSKKIEEAVLIALSRILAVNTNFIKNANIEKSEVEKITIKIKEEGFELCKSLFKSNTKKEDENSLSIYIPPSFTQILNTICSPMKHSISDVHTILTTPILISSYEQEFSKPRLLTVFLNKWKKINPIFEEKPQSILEEDEDHKRTQISLKAHVSATELIDLVSSIEKNRVMVAALNLAPLILTPSNSSKLIKWICSKVINKEEAIGAMAVRSLQASIHINSDNATRIINELYSYLTDNISTVTPDSIYCIVSALKYILEATTFERIPLSKTNFQHVFFIISIGLVSSCYITRSVALDATKIIQNPIVSSFFKQLDDVTSERGKELLFSVLCPGMEEVDDIDSIKFSNFARSKVSYLYTFYIAAYAESLMNTKFESDSDVFASIPADSSSDQILPANALADSKDIIDSSKEIADDLRRYFIQLLSHSKNFENDDPYFIIYMITFIFASWKEDDKEKHRIHHFVKKLCELKINGIEEWCAASTSCISPSLFSKKLVDHLPPRAFALYLLKCAKEPNFIDDNCCVNNEAFKNGYLKVINSFFELNCISKDATFSINKSNSCQSHYQTALYAFGKAVTAIFSAFSKNQMKCLLGCNGIFPRTMISQPIVDSILTSNESYAFWFNLSSEDELYFSIPCQTAYAELVKIMYIPDIWFELVTNNIEKIVDHTPDIAITLFTHYSGVLMPIYIRNSQSSYSFFAGIAKQFCTSDDFIEEWREKIASVPTINPYDKEESKGATKIDKDVSPDVIEKNILMKTMNAAKRFSDLILRNIGTLLAIATSYLIGSDVFQRMTAFDFIYVTSLSTHLVYANDVNETLNLSSELLSVKETFLTNFEQFFANTASKVIYSLANHLPFLSEQFCSGIFAVESIKGGKRREKEETELMNELEAASESQQININSLKKAKQRGNLLSNQVNKGGNRMKSIIPLPPNPNQFKFQTLSSVNQSGIREVSLTGIAQYNQISNTNDAYNMNNTNYGNYNNGNSSFLARKTSSKNQVPLCSVSSSLAMIPISSLDPKNKTNLVLSSFDNNSKELSRYIASFIVPWMKRIRFVPESLHVFQGCLPSYRMFSMYTFIQSIVRLKSLLPITPPITDILYPTYKAAGPLFLIVLTDLYFKMPDLQENVVAMITYAYTINSKHVMNYFLSFLNVRYWYYQQIQISKLNQAFDFRLFLQDMQVSGESDDDQHDQDVIIDYVGIINFVLKMFITFMKENPVQILPYKNKIITFCALGFREFVQPAQKIFHLFLSLKPPGSIKTEKSINYIGPYTYDAIMEIFEQSISSNIISLIKPSLYSSSPSSLSTAVATGVFNSGASLAPDENTAKFHKTYSFDLQDEQQNDNNQLGSQLNSASQTNLQNYLAVKNKTAVINAFSKKSISHFLIEWGLICGDSFIASLALKMFISLRFKATEAEVNYALDSIYMIYMMVKDAATTRNTHGRQTLLKLADSDAKPDYATAYNHIQYLCLLCQNVQSNPSTELVHRILLTSFALLLLPEPGKVVKDLTKAKPEPTITAALRNIYKYRNFLPDFHPDKLIEMRLDSTRELIKDNDDANKDHQHQHQHQQQQHGKDKDKDIYDETQFQGFTFYLFASSLNEESLKLSSDILFYLLQKKLTFLLNGNEIDPCFTYYAIAPFIFADKSTHNSEDEIEDKEIKEAYLGIANQQSQESLENFHKFIVKNRISKIKKKEFVNSCFERLCNFYRTIVRIGKIQEVKAVLIISSLIIRDHLLSSTAQVLGELSREIIQKRDHELKENVNEFYKLLVIEFGGQISTQKKTLSIKNMPNLIGGLNEQDVLEWRPSDLLTTLRTGIDSGVSTDDDEKITSTTTAQQKQENDEEEEDNKDNQGRRKSSSLADSDQNINNNNNDSSDDSDDDYNDIDVVVGDNDIGKRDNDDSYVDVFKKPKFYPPIFLTDYALFVSDFMNNLLPVVEQVKVQPFTRWDIEIFCEEQAAEKTTNKGNPNENSFAVCFDDELEGDEKLALSKNDKKIRKVAKELQKVMNERYRHKSKESRLVSTINPVHSSSQFCMVDSELFCPTLDMVDKISPTDDSREDDLPSIIQ